MVLLHNEVRSKVGVPGLKWSRELAAYAQEWADHLASLGCALEHRPPSGQGKHNYGENIYTGPSSPESLAEAVATWESEKSFYRGQPLSASDLRAMHYTQMVWRATTQFGCGRAECEDQVIIVRNYSPAGNMLGQKPY
jgi:pathogenesis-related protein 1